MYKYYGIVPANEINLSTNGGPHCCAVRFLLSYVLGGRLHGMSEWERHKTQQHELQRNRRRKKTYAAVPNTTLCVWLGCSSTAVTRYVQSILNLLFRSVPFEIYATTLFFVRKLIGFSLHWTRRRCKKWLNGDEQSLSSSDCNLIWLAHRLKVSSGVHPKK